MDRLEPHGQSAGGGEIRKFRGIGLDRSTICRIQLPHPASGHRHGGNRGTDALEVALPEKKADNKCIKKIDAKARPTSFTVDPPEIDGITKKYLGWNRQEEAQ